MAEALFHGIEAGKGPEQGEIGRPDMRRNIDRPGAQLQQDFQQVLAVQPQNGAAVRVNIPNGLQLAGDQLRLFQAGEQNQAVHLSDPAMLFINGADLPCYNKLGACAPRRAVWNPELFFQCVKAAASRFQLFPQLFPPGGVGKIAGAHQADALAPGP